jgi:hypothetical protein
VTTAITDVSGFGTCVTVVDSVDPANAATMLVLLQPLANRTRYLKNSVASTVTAVKASTYTAAIGELVRVDTSAGAVTINLPTAVGNAGHVIVVKKVDAGAVNDVTIDGTGSETIDGSTTNTIVAASEARGSRTLVSDGANWLVI